MGLDTVELIMAVEDRFGIDISDQEAERLVTVGLLHQCVVDELTRRGSAVEPQRLYEELRALICEQLGVPPEQVVPGAHFIDDLRVD